MSGMMKQTDTNDASFSYTDRASGRTVRQLTTYRGHSSHPYFTDPCWFNDGRSFVFTSDRDGASNVYRYDIDDGAVRRLSDLTGVHKENERVFDYRPQPMYSAANDRAYYWWRNTLFELDVETGAERTVYTAPENVLLGIHAATSADGKYICTAMRDRVESKAPSLEYPYHKFPELMRARPKTAIIRIEVATGACETIHEEEQFITHVNHSPTLPNVLTFCHEGHWEHIEQRIWGLDITTGKRWKIRDQSDRRYTVGHEYWFADGERIGYHGRPRSGAADEHVYGFARWDGSDVTEVTFPYHSNHFASADEKVIVGDGTPVRVSLDTPYIMLYARDGERFTEPRVLAEHRCTFNHQHSHCHPRFTPDGRSILFVSDATGYAQLYLVEIGAIEELPRIEEVRNALA